MKILEDKIICGNAIGVLKDIPSETIDCVMTSPPYWALRDYGISPQIWDGDGQCRHEWELRDFKDPMDRGGNGDHDSLRGIAGKWEMKSHQSGFCLACNAWKGSLGLEPTFDLFIKHICDIFDEVKRVLKAEGTCWVNLGDTYASSPSGNAINWEQKNGDGVYQRLARRHNQGGTSHNTPKPKDYGNYPQKSLCMIPFRFAIEMVNRGWILRNTIIWRKPNCMPSSAKDRFTVDFEYVFFFTKAQKYWFEPQYEDSKTMYKKIDFIVRDYAKKKKPCPNFKIGPFGQEQYHGKNIEYGNMRNKRSVWTITTRPYKEAHFATYPSDLCETPIKAGCPQFICKKCGKARKKIFKPSEEYQKLLNKSWTEDTDKSKALRAKIGFQANTKKVACTQDYRFVGYTDCGCNAGFASGIVLDPFCGSGTTLVVAKRLGRRYLGIDVNLEYVNMAKERVENSQVENNNLKGENSWTY